MCATVAVYYGQVHVIFIGMLGTPESDELLDVVNTNKQQTNPGALFAFLQQKLVFSSLYTSMHMH